MRVASKLMVKSWMLTLHLAHLNNCLPSFCNANSLIPHWLQFIGDSASWASVIAGWRDISLICATQPSRWPSNYTRLELRQPSLDSKYQHFITSDSISDMSLDFETVVEQEVKRLQVIHPTPEDIPGCMRLLDDFLSCHGTPSITLLLQTGSDHKWSTRHTVEVLIQIWWQIPMWT